MLRESAMKSGLVIALEAITIPGVAIGFERGELALEFADAVSGTEQARLSRVQQRIIDLMGAPALFGAAAIAANFSRNDRIANAIGIPLEKEFVEQSVDFRETLGINTFRSAINTLLATQRE